MMRKYLNEVETRFFLFFLNNFSVLIFISPAETTDRRSAFSSSMITHLRTHTSFTAILTWRA